MTNKRILLLFLSFLLLQFTKEKEFIIMTFNLAQRIIFQLKDTFLKTRPKNGTNWKGFRLISTKGWGGNSLNLLCDKVLNVNAAIIAKDFQG